MPLLNNLVKRQLAVRHKRGTATYTVSASAASINEGQSVTFTITTRNVPSGTTLYYTLGNMTAADISGGAVSGTVTVSNNIGTVSVTTASDSATEGTETMIFQLRTVSTSGTIVATANVTILDTSTAGLSVDYLVVPGVG